MKKKSGYTLMELIVVLAIIGILTAILVPTWTYMVTNGRIRTATANAKAIFGAAQTAATERKVYESVYTGAADQYMTAGEFYFYWDGTNGVKVSDTGITDGTATDAQNNEFTEKINKMLDNSCVYKIYIRNYQVRSVVAARRDNDRFVGSYPISFEEAEDGNTFAAQGTSADIQEAAYVVSRNLKCFALNP